MKKPSVSQLLSLLDKPALLNWANKQGLQGIDITKERKGWLRAGTSIHNQIENFIKSKAPFLNELDQNNFLKFIEDKEIIDFEKNIETEWFQGRYDLKVKWNDKVYLMDFKNNAKDIYFENKLQLIAYSMAEECDGFAIINVPKFEIFEVKIQNRNPFIEVLKSLSNIYYCKKEIEVNEL